MSKTIEPALEQTNPAGDSVPQQLPRRSSLPILTLAILFAIATFLTWYFTWFGRELSDSDISKYLADENHPRHVQHALLQIQQRVERGDQTARQWYPRMIQLAGSAETEYRLTVAWVMGFDNHADEFHQTLLKLIRDNEPMVRRNAALALVRFNDASGRAELLAMLRPYPLASPADGLLNSTLNQGSQVSRGTLVARVRRDDASVVEVRSPLPGKIDSLAIHDGTTVKTGVTLLTVTADATSIWEALRGLALVGRSEDLPEIERYSGGVDELPARIKEQATRTAESIRSRAGASGL